MVNSYKAWYIVKSWVLVFFCLLLGCSWTKFHQVVFQRSFMDIARATAREKYGGWWDGKEIEHPMIKEHRIFCLYDAYMEPGDRCAVAVNVHTKKSIVLSDVVEFNKIIEEEEISLKDENDVLKVIKLFFSLVIEPQNLTNIFILEKSEDLVKFDEISETELESKVKERIESEFNKTIEPKFKEMIKSPKISREKQIYRICLWTWESSWGGLWFWEIRLTDKGMITEIVKKVVDTKIGSYCPLE